VPEPGDNFSRAERCSRTRSARAARAASAAYPAAQHFTDAIDILGDLAPYVRA